MNLCSARQPPTPLEEPQTPKSPSLSPDKQRETIASIKSELNERAIKEETSSNASIKAWSSFPELNDERNADVVPLTTTSLATSAKTTQGGGAAAAEKRVAQSIELSDVIKVDYAETKAVDASTFSEPKCSPGECNNFDDCILSVR